MEADIRPPSTIVTQSETLQEIEYKWRVAGDRDVKRLREALVAAGATLTPPRRLEIRDHYVDTEDRFFLKAGVRCRIRSKNGGSWEITLKSTGSSAGNGAFTRTERTIALESATTESEALDALHGPALGNELGGRRVDLVLAIDNRREVQEVRLADGTRAELCADTVLAKSGDERSELREVELEFEEGDARALADAVSRMASSVELTPSDVSKFEASANALGIASAPPPLPKESFSRDDPVGVAARAVIARQTAVLERNDPGVRLGMNDEAIHDMRVATRRLRAALSVFDEFLPERERKVHKDLSWLRKSLGEGRDLEVQAARMTSLATQLPAEQRVHTDSYVGKLTDRLAAESSGALEVLESRRYRAMIDELHRLADSRVKGKAKKRTVAEHGARAIERRLSKIVDRYPRRIDPDSEDALLHRIRIDLKAVRYTCEFFRRTGSAELLAFIRETKKLQDVLGDHQDACTGRDMLRKELDAAVTEAPEIESSQDSDEVVAATGTTGPVGPPGAGAPSPAPRVADAGDEDRVALEALLAVVETGKARLRTDFFSMWHDYRRKKHFRSVVASLEDD